MYFNIALVSKVCTCIMYQSPLHSAGLFQETCQKNILTRFSRAVFSQRKTHYDVLGIKRNASALEIRDAFVTLSKEIHPDRNPDDPENHAKFVRLNEAYTTLSKTTTRQEYDMNLAHWLRVRDTIARNTSTYSAGSTSPPGSASNAKFYESNQQERVFWDETIFHMRNRRKDARAFYPDDTYYGIKGLRRQSNGVVAIAFCTVLLLLGTGYFLIALKYSARKRAEHYERVDRVNMRILKEVKELARINGNAKQLEILDAKIAAKEKAARERQLVKSSDKSE